MKYDDFILRAIITVMLVCTLLLLWAFIYSLFSPNKECAIYSELKTKQGFVVAGKVTVPTTYQSRDCLVYKEAK